MPCSCSHVVIPEVLTATSVKTEVSGKLRRDNWHIFLRYIAAGDTSSCITVASRSMQLRI
jgi:hypothetical protein